MQAPSRYFLYLLLLSLPLLLFPEWYFGKKDVFLSMLCDTWSGCTAAQEKLLLQLCCSVGVLSFAHL